MSSQVPEPSLSGPTQPSGTLAFDVDEAGRYQRIGLLGQGGMGRVYLARDTRLERDVALKEVLQEGPDTEARLVREALLTAQLDHPGIVPVYDAGRTREGRLFYTMRLVRGRRLGDLVRETGSLEARLRLVPHVLEVARALAFAHEREVVHRDVKPDNVLIGPRGETQLSDWGLARRLAQLEPLQPGPGATPSLADASLTTLDGRLVGTARYAAPELASGATATRESDVYALGCLLLEVVGGAPPWGALGVDTIRARQSVGQCAPASFSQATPAALVTIVRRALEAAPHERYASAGALADDLAAFLDGRLVTAHAYSARELFVHFGRTWRVPLLAGGVALAFALVALGAAAVVARSERDRALAAEHAIAARTAELLLQRARDLDATEQAPEMEWLAAQAAALTPGSPRALGLLMAADPAGPRLFSSVPLPRCRLGRPLPGGAACLTPAGLQVLSADGSLAREVPLVGAQTFVLDETEGFALVLAGESLWRVTLATGALALAGGAPTYAVGLGLDSRLGVAWAFNPAVLQLTGWGQTREMTPCAPSVELLGVVSIGNELEFLCSDGAVRRAPPLELLNAAVEPGLFALWKRPPAASVSPALLQGATVVVAEDETRRLVGTVRGAVVRLDLLLGTSVLLAQRSHLGPIRQVLPVGPAVLLVGERGAPTLVAREGGQTLATLPGWTRGAARRDGKKVSLFGRALGTWDFAGATASRAVAPVGLASIAASADGRWAMLAGADGWFAKWNRSTGQTGVVPLGLTQVVKSVAVSTDGRRAVVGAVGLPGVAVHALGTEQTTRHLALPAMRRVGWLADGTAWAMGYELAPYFLRDGAWLETLGVQRRQWRDASTTADGRAVVLLDANGAVLTATSSTLAVMDQRPGATAVVALGPEGPFFFAHDTAVWSSTGASLELEEGFVTALALGPEGRWLAVGTSTGALLVVAPKHLEVVARASLHRDRVSALSFSREGTLFSVGWDQQARVWNLAPLTATPRADDVAARWGFLPGEP